MEDSGFMWVSDMMASRDVWSPGFVKPQVVKTTKTHGVFNDTGMTHLFAKLSGRLEKDLPNWVGS